MTELVATTPGLYPLPDQAKAELAGLKGRQKEDLIDGSEGAEVAAAYRRARETVVDDGIAAGLDRAVEGQLRWDDMLAHPLVVADAVKPGGIVRYYDNNNFYREPRVTGDLEATGDVAGELEAATELVDGGLQAVLPGPYTLSELATDDHYGDDAAFLDAVAAFLAAELARFPAHETLFLLDPSLAVTPPTDGYERLVDAISTVAEATAADVVLHTYWGTVDERTYAHLMDAEIDTLGFDLVAGDRDATLYNVTEYGTTETVALGVVDGQNTRVESPETVRERVAWFDENVPSKSFDRVYVTSNTELFYLPVRKYRAKLEALGRAAADRDGAVDGTGEVDA